MAGVTRKKNYLKPPTTADGKIVFPIKRRPHPTFQVPWGYQPAPEDPLVLLPIHDHLMLLYHVARFTPAFMGKQQMTWQDAAALISEKSGKPLSVESLKSKIETLRAYHKTEDLIRFSDEQTEKRQAAGLATTFEESIGVEPSLQKF